MQSSGRGNTYVGSSDICDDEERNTEPLQSMARGVANSWLRDFSDKTKCKLSNLSPQPRTTFLRRVNVQGDEEGARSRLLGATFCI